MRTAAAVSWALALDLMLTTASVSQHTPGCDASHHGQGTTCWGYATARAFGRTWSDARCPAGTRIGITSVDNNFFTDHQFDVSLLQAGYLVGWGNPQLFEPTHVAYVISSDGTLEGTSMAQVENAGATVEHSDLTLAVIIAGDSTISARGYPAKYYVKRPLSLFNIPSEP